MHYVICCVMVFGVSENNSLLHSELHFSPEAVIHQLVIVLLYTGLSESLCAPDDCNTESFK
jgi:hypothetical protein